MWYIVVIAALTIVALIVWALALRKGFISGWMGTYGSLVIGFLASLPWLLYKREDSTKPTPVLPAPNYTYVPTKQDVQELDVLIEKTIADPVQIQPREVSNEKADEVLTDFIDSIK